MPLTSPLDRSYLLRFLRRLWRQRLGERGRFLLPLAALLGFVGVDTRRALPYVLFALAAGPLVAALVAALRRAPPVRIDVALPHRLTAGRALALPLTVRCTGARAEGPLLLSLASATPSAGGAEGARLDVEPCEAFLQAAPQRPARLGVRLRASHRGRYLLAGPRVARTDPLGLMATRAVSLPAQPLVVYPRFFTLDEGELALQVGRRYQPGGVPLASQLGDSTEFVGTRDYREGDALRHIHWRSFARRGQPVVKEHQEEYFSRIALVLDTFLPRRPRPAERLRFEAAVSVLASVADHFSRSEQLVDILAAGPDLYEVSVGRSLAYLENVLDVLACLEPCHEPPFAKLGPPLLDKLARLTTVVAVLLDWDLEREAFLQRLAGLGVAVHVLLVHEGTTREPWQAAAGELAELRLLAPADVERRIVAEEAARLPDARAREAIA